jgi:hypothetical protein
MILDRFGVTWVYAIEIVDQNPGPSSTPMPQRTLGMRRERPAIVVTGLSVAGRGGRRTFAGFMLPLFEPTHDLVGDLGRFAADIDDDRVLVRRGFF